MLANEAVIDAAIAAGFDLAGVAQACEPPHLAAYGDWIDAGRHGTMTYLDRHRPLKDDPASLLPSVKSIIAVALNYNQPNPPRPGEPRIARYALGRDYHRVVRSKLRKLQAQLPAASYRICVDSAPLMERDFAQLAGIGWFGKNTMIINSHRGSWFVLGFLLTTLEIEPSQPARGGCGTCRACIDACPTGAIIEDEGRWQVDARNCISYLTIEHKGDLTADVGDWTFGCDVCQEVCPFNHPGEKHPLRAQITTDPGFLQTRVWPNLSELRQISREDWDQLTAGSAVRRAGHNGLRRNAAANPSPRRGGH